MIAILLIDKAIKQPGLEISVVSESIPHLRRGWDRKALHMGFKPSTWEYTL